MPNTSLRVGCGNKIVYIPSEKPHNLQSGRILQTGLGVRDECCKCECPCETGCRFLENSAGWFDFFYGDPGDSLPASYTAVGVPWAYTGANIPSQPPLGEIQLQGPGTGSLSIQGDVAENELNSTFTGWVDISSTAGAVQVLSNTITADIGNGKTLEVSAEYEYSVDSDLGIIKFSILAGDAAPFYEELEWTSIPNVYIGLRIFCSRDEVSVCLQYNHQGKYANQGNPNAGIESRSVVLSGVNGTDTVSNVVTTFSGTAASSDKSVYALSFCCPFANCAGNFTCSWEDLFDTALQQPPWAVQVGNWETINGNLRGTEPTFGGSRIGAVYLTFPDNNDFGIAVHIGPMTGAFYRGVSMMNNNGANELAGVQVYDGSYIARAGVNTTGEVFQSLSPGALIELHNSSDGLCVGINGELVVSDSLDILSTPYARLSYECGPSGTRWVEFQDICVNLDPNGAAAQLGPVGFSRMIIGPGTAARQIFSQYGCDGRSYIHTMNNNGLQWCKENVELIADWIIRSAKLKGKSADKNKTIQELEFVFSTLEDQKNLS